MVLRSLLCSIRYEGIFRVRKSDSVSIVGYADDLFYNYHIAMNHDYSTQDAGLKTRASLMTIRKGVAGG